MYEIALKKIEEIRPTMDKLRMDHWNNPEGPYREFEAQKLQAKVLEEAGFKVELGYAGVPTSIRASYGSGHPVIGFLGEFDALPGMAQECTSKKSPIENQAYGQGCGHNLLGVAQVSAVIAIKEEMEAKGIKGTIVYYGCPAEEVLTGKGFMARGGAFKELDCAIAFHPGAMNTVSIGTMTGLNSVKFHFKGRTAHAGGDPHNGRSAVDAMELTSVGANYLREHVTSDVRIHYTILEGGTAPNIVPDKASVWYYVRALSREAVVDTYKRLVKVAEGAAHMTETELEVELLGGCYNTLANKVLAREIHKALENVKQDEWTEEEIQFAKQLNNDMPTQYQKALMLTGSKEGTQLHTGMLPIVNQNGYGSTDVGDVMHIVPGVMFTTACYAIGAPGHSWQVTACSGHSIGEKGMTYAARGMAHFALELLTKPELVEEAKQEFNTVRAGREYECPVPAEVPVP